MLSGVALQQLAKIHCDILVLRSTAATDEVRRTCQRFSYAEEINVCTVITIKETACAPIVVTVWSQRWR